MNEQYTLILKEKILMNLGFLGDLITEFLATPEGREIVRQYLSSPEGASMMDAFLTTPEGHQLAMSMVPQLLESLNLPIGTKEIILAALAQKSEEQKPAK